MASKKRYFPELWKELNGSEPILHPAYLIYGPEELLARKAVERIAELCGEIKPFDYVEFAGNDVDMGRLGEELSTLPMSAERRLVFVYLAEKVLAKAGRGASSKESQFLKSAIRDNASSACLVFQTSPELSLGSIPGRTLHSSFARYGVYPLSEAKLVSWITRGVRQRGLSLGPRAAAELIAAVGTSLIDIENELDKLAVYLGEGGVVKPEVIEDLVGERGASLKDFLDSVATRDIPAALASLEIVLLLSRNSYRLIPALVGLFMEIHSALTVAPDEFAKMVPRWRIREVMGWSRQWSKNETLAAIDALFQAEFQLKSGTCRIQQALTPFLCGLVQSGTGA